jgi:hemolysin D
MKLTAYPFQKYGMLEGAVRQVSADAQDRNSTAEVNAKGTGELAYRAIIALDTDTLDGAGQRLRLVPGMHVSAEVHIGRRSVLEYLLSPLQKVVSEAARER